MNTGRRLGTLSLVAIVLIVGGVAVQDFNTQDKTKKSEGLYPPPGRMVDIGGYLLHLHCIGRGSPTVVLEAGNGTMSSDWAWVQPEVAKTTRVCAYDRAGVAWSEPSPQPRDALHIAQELHTLLARAGVRAPLVLVGHSFGGLYVREYAALFPAEVVGLVLVDAAHPDQWTRPDGGQEQLNALLTMAQQPVVPTPDPPPANPDLPPYAGAQIRALTNSTSHRGAATAEFLATITTNDEVRRTSRTLGALPLVVVTATESRPRTRSSAIRQKVHTQKGQRLLEHQNAMFGSGVGGMLSCAAPAERQGVRNHGDVVARFSQQLEHNGQRVMVVERIGALCGAVPELLRSR